MLDARFPRALQFLFEPHRYKGIRGGRGKGASWGMARALLIMAAQRPLRVLCARETQKSIADSVHALLADQAKALGLQSIYDVQQQTILGANGSEFIFAGLKHNINNIKSVEGCDIAWVEEAQSTSQESWSTLIPTIRKDYQKRGLPRDPAHVCTFVGCCSEIWISWNDILATDETHKRFVLNPPPGAVIKKLTYRDNPWFPEVLRVEMEHLKATSYNAYLHVWEGECITEVEGAIFAEELRKADEQGRICSVPYDPTKPVHTAWDLGFGDPTCIWFVQPRDGYLCFIDYMQASEKTIADHIVALQRRPQAPANAYLYGEDHLPHDAVDSIIHHRLIGNGDKTKSIEYLMRAAGRKVRVAPKLLKPDALNAARTIFPLCRFDAVKCADGLQALRHYQWDRSETEPGKRKPLHDQYSHGTDAFLTAAVSIKREQHEPAYSAPRAPRYVTEI